MQKCNYFYIIVILFYFYLRIFYMMVDLSKIKNKKFCFFLYTNFKIIIKILVSAKAILRVHELFFFASVLLMLFQYASSIEHFQIFQD